MMDTPFGREIDSDILISSSKGSKTSIIFLTKLIYLFETASSPGDAVQHNCPLLLINML